jgi:rubredoxin
MPEFKCPECGYVFSEEAGDDHEGYPPGTSFQSLPDDYVCPDCSVRYNRAIHPETKMRAA